MTPTPVRIWGDPFAGDAESAALGRFLRAATEAGLDCSVDLTAARGGGPGHGRQEVQLSDGVRKLVVHTDASASVVAAVCVAAERPVPSTTPVVVFAPGDQLAWVKLAWPMACAVVDAGERSVEDLIGSVRRAVATAGVEDPVPCLQAAQLKPLAALAPNPAGYFLHVGSDDPADGTDVAVRTFVERLSDCGRELVVLLTAAAPGFEDVVRAIAAECAEAAVPPIVIERGPLASHHLAGAAIVLLPLRILRNPGELLMAMASGRPTVVSRFAGTASLLDQGTCQPIGGRHRPAEKGAPACFEPDPRGLEHGVRAVLAEPTLGIAMGLRARSQVVTRHLAGRPVAAARTVSAHADRGRPRVVLEAPFFEVSSAAELSIETALALQRRDRVDLQLVPCGGDRCGPAALAARAPSLLRCLVGQSRGADLWLASGWPPRTSLPPARTFAVRFDWEYGAVPLEVCPMVSQEADRVVVHSNHVLRTVAAAGRPVETIELVPHGVDGEQFRDEGPTLERIEGFKDGRPAVSFVGGLIWRKGIDVFLGALLQATVKAPPFCVVIKSMGGSSHYHGYHLAELVERFRQTPGAPDLLVVDEELDRARLASLYRSCDLLFHPYRGEGFGMPVLEARACGLPVLVTGGGSTDDFTDGPGIVQIPAVKRTLTLPGPHMGQPWVLEPDAEVAGCLLVQSLASLERLRAEARSAAGEVRTRYTWDAAAKRIEHLAVRELAATARS